MNKDLANTKKKENKSAVWLGIVACVLSVVALCVSFVRTEPMVLDLFGVFISVLSILVVVLLGFQLYSVINFEKNKNRVFDITSEVEAKSESMLFFGCFATNYAIAMGHYNANHTYMFLKYGMSALEYGLKINQKEDCKWLILALCEVCKKELRLTLEEQSVLLKSLCKIEIIDEKSVPQELRVMLLKATILE